MEEKSSKKILIIEDEKELVLSLTTLLKSKGYITVVAYDGLYGVSLAHKKNPDLIILDLGLPAGGGFFVLENLKKSVDTDNIPVLVLTARQEEEWEEKAYQMGVVAYIRKPFEPQGLLDRIKEILDKK